MTSTPRKTRAKATPRQGKPAAAKREQAKAKPAQPKGLAGLFGILTDEEADQLAAHVSKLRGYPILGE